MVGDRRVADMAMERAAAVDAAPAGSVAQILRDDLAPSRGGGFRAENAEDLSERDSKRRKTFLEIQELEVRVEEAKARAEEAKARAATALEEKQRAQETRRIGNAKEWIQMNTPGGVVRMSPADSVAVNDMMRTLTLGGSGAEAELGLPICLEAFLRSKGVRDATTSRASFGKAVLKEWRQTHQEDPPKKGIYAHGQAMQVNAYWEADRAIIEEAFAKWHPTEEVQVAPSSRGLARFFGVR